MQYSSVRKLFEGNRVHHCECSQNIIIVSVKHIIKLSVLSQVQFLEYSSMGVRVGVREIVGESFKDVLIKQIMIGVGQHPLPVCHIVIQRIMNFKVSLSQLLEGHGLDLLDVLVVRQPLEVHQR